MPCFCKDNEYKVKLADGLVVNCIPCKNPWNDSAGCKGDCEGRRHLCENTEPFPKTEAYECVKPETGLEFIEHHAVHTCRRCQTNEISFGCSCYADRRCECPEDTHSRDSTHNCVAREIEQVSTKIAPSFPVSSISTSSIAPTSSLTETFSNTDTVNSSTNLNSSATAFAIKTTSESISPTASTLVVENSLVVEKVRPQSHKIPYEIIILIVGLFVFVVLVVFALYFSFKNFIKKYLSKFFFYFCYKFDMP